MTLGDASLCEGVLDCEIEVEKAQGIGDCRSCLADSRSDLFLSQGEVVGELAVGVGFLHRVEVGPLHIFDEGYGELVALSHLADDRWDVVQAGHLGRSDPSLSRDQLVSVEHFCDEDRLEDAMHTNAGRELFECVLLDPLSRLIGVAANARNRDLHRCRARGAGLGDQGAKPSPETGVSLRMRLRHRGSPSAIAASVRATAASLVWGSAAELAATGRPSRARNSAASEAYASAPLESGR